MKELWESAIRPIVEAARPKVLVEVGAEAGANTRNLLEACRRHGGTVHSIDPAPSFDPAAWEAEYGDRLVFHRGRSLDALPSISGIDLVLLDGDHNFYTVLNELRALEEGSRAARTSFPLVLLHDVGWPYGRRDQYYDPDSVPAAHRQAYVRRGLVPGVEEPVPVGGLNPDFNNATTEGGERNGVRTAVDVFLREAEREIRSLFLPGFHGLGVLAEGEYLTTHPEVAELFDWLRSPEFLDRHLDELERARIEEVLARGDAERRLAGAGEGMAELERRIGDLGAAQTRLEQRGRDHTRLARRLSSEIEGLQRRAVMTEGALHDLNRRAVKLEARSRPLWRLRGGLRVLSWLLRRPGRIRPRHLRAYLTLRRSGRFDEGFYLAGNPDLAVGGRFALAHYVLVGAAEGRDPSPDFDTERYLEARPELRELGINPLLHLIETEGRTGAGSPSIAAGPLPEELEASLASAVPGDAELLVAAPEGAMPRLERHTARPFPPPSDALGGAQSRGTTAAIACLEALRSRGARFLLVPPATDDWLGRQRGFRWHLESRSRKLFADGDWSLFALGDRVGEAKPWRLQLESLVEEYEASSTDPPSILEWGRDPGVASRFPWRSRFESRDERDRLPFLDDSFDLVVVEASGSAAARDEARRVAREAAIAVGPGDGARALEIERLRRPRAELPSASIVIPTHDGATLLNRCLGTLAETIPECVEVELLIVDDASSDSTASVVERWRDAIGSLKMVRNDTNLGFIESCNAGAAAASGEALVFLNNDTLPLPGWLVPLLRSLREPDVGAVGGKVVYPDGRLQEAGAVVFSTGDCANFGRGEDNPDAPLFQYVREVDYCSGALLATPRAQFIEMGGFDLEFRPAYYEDVDYAFRVRRAGGRVLYQPESAIVHDEGASATEVKRFQAINRPKFAARWAAELAHQPDPPAQWGPATWYGLAGRGTRETDWA